MATSNPVGSQPFLSFDEFLAITEAAGSGAAGTSPAPGASASASQTEALGLLSVLDLALPANDAGHGVTADPKLQGRLLAFLGLDPSDQAASLKAAVQSGTVTDEQYSQIADLLRTQGGAAPAAAAPDVTVDPAVAASAEKAAALDDLDAVFIPNPLPAEVSYQFTFAGPQGKAFKDWMERSAGGISYGEGVDRFNSDDGEIPEALFKKALNGEDLTEEEYKQVWKAIRVELDRNRGESDWEVSKQVGHEVLALAADDGVTTSQGYLFEGDGGSGKFNWMDEQGNALELTYPKDDNSTDVPAGICIKGTSAELHGDFSVPEDKRQGVIDFLQSLPQSDSNNQLIEAVKSGKLNAEQRDQIILLADQVIVASKPGQAGSETGLYAGYEEFGQAIGAPVYTVDQYVQWL